MAALRSFGPPIVLIAGGREKGVDIGELAVVVAERADAVVLIGESAAPFRRAFEAAGARQVETAATLEAAVDRADDLARDALARAALARAGGDGGPTDAAAKTGAPAAAPLATVLLSPAAASFDMFTDYAARGRAFKAAVAALIERRSRG